MPTRRERYSVPNFVRDALAVHGLMNAYRERPPHQQNSCLGWIGRAKLEETRLRRLSQMLDELKQGGIYMKMKWRGAPTQCLALPVSDSHHPLSKPDHRSNHGILHVRCDFGKQVRYLQVLRALLQALSALHTH